MKLIIAGSRDIDLSDATPLDDDVPFHYPNTGRLAGILLGAFGGSGIYEGALEIVAGGGARGVDAAARAMATIYRDVHYTEFPADWKKLGKAAGPLRNRQMAEYADALLLIWDGQSPGSASMLDEARHAGLRIVQVIMEPQQGRML